MEESKPLPGYAVYLKDTWNEPREPLLLNFKVTYKSSKKFLWSWFFTPKWKLRKLDFWGRIDNKGRFYPEIIWGNMKVKYHNRGKLNREYKVKYKQYGSR